jgi:hypothetical protein
MTERKKQIGLAALGAAAVAGAGFMLAGRSTGKKRQAGRGSAKVRS